MRRRIAPAILSPALMFALASIGLGQEVTINVHAGRVLHTVSRLLTGACIEDVNHEIYGGIYSQMIFGESFQEPPASGVAGAVSGMWTASDTGSADGRCSLETTN